VKWRRNEKKEKGMAEVELICRDEIEKENERETNAWIGFAWIIEGKSKQLQVENREWVGMPGL